MRKRFTREPLKGSTRGRAKDVTGNKMFTTAFRSIKKAKWLQQGARREALSLGIQPRVKSLLHGYEDVTV